MAGPIIATPVGWRRTFAALRTYNYRLYFVGECVSSMGSWMQVMAEAWLVLELTRRVERIDVHDRATGAQGAHDRDGILEDVRHHQGDAVALPDAGFLLQPGAEIPRQGIDVAVRERAGVGVQRRRVTRGLPQWEGTGRRHQPTLPPLSAFENTVARAEEQLYGIRGANTFTTPTEAVTDVINYDQTGAAAGQWTVNTSAGGEYTDKAMPLADPAATDNIAAEILTILDLPIGAYELGVNHDDGFKLTAGAEPRDVFKARLLSSSANALDTPGINIVVTNAGTVPHEWMVTRKGMTDHVMGVVDISRDQLKPGATVSKESTFKEAGECEFACHEPGHYEAGMALPITAG